MPTDLLPCPFCGSALVEVYSQQGLGATVACVACQAEGPWTAGDGDAIRLEAVRLWNQRAERNREAAEALSGGGVQ